MPAVEANPETVSQPSFRRYWLSLYRRDVEQAAGVVRAAGERNWSAPRQFYRLFRPALNLSGTLFERGVISYDEEHFITFHTCRFLRDVRRRLIPTETSGPLALATGVGQESHLIGLRMVCDCLKLHDWRIHWAASSDRGVIRDAVAALRPSAVLLSIGMRSGIVPAGRLIAELRRQRYQGVIAIGGRAVLMDDALTERLGADLTAREGVELARRLRRWAGARRAAE
jgi:methanogenic corrinoid protein MtbC1